MDKFKTKPDNSQINNFGVSTKLHPRVITGINGTPAGVYALSESLKRGDAYLRAQERINELCLPLRDENSFELINEFLEGEHNFRKVACND